MTDKVIVSRCTTPQVQFLASSQCVDYENYIFGPCLRQPVFSPEGWYCLWSVPRTISFMQFKSLCLSFFPPMHSSPLTIHPQYLQVKQGLSRSKLLLNHIQHQQPWRHMYADEKGGGWEGGGMKRVDTASPAHICVACIRLKSKPSPALVFFIFFFF